MSCAIDCPGCKKLRAELDLAIQRIKSLNQELGQQKPCWLKNRSLGECKDREHRSTDR